MQREIKFRGKALMVSRDIEIFDGRNQAYDNFFEDSGWLREAIEIMYDKALMSDNQSRIRTLLFNLPQK